MDRQPSKWSELVAEGRAAFSQENFDLAEKKFLGALDMAEEFPGRGRELEQSLSLLAFFYCHLERYLDAEGYWLRGLQLLEQVYSSEAQEVGTYIYNMAERVYRPWGKRAEADRLRSRAEAICGEGFFRDAEPPAS